MMEIAASFIIRDDDKAHCNIKPNGGCTYVHEAQRTRESQWIAKKPRVVAKRPIAINLQLLIEAVVRLVTDHGLPLSCFEWHGFLLGCCWNVFIKLLGAR